MPRVFIRDEYNQYTVEFPNKVERTIQRIPLEKFFRNADINFRYRMSNREGVFQVNLNDDIYTSLRNLCGLYGGYRSSLVKKTSRKFKKSSRRNNYV